MKKNQSLTILALATLAGTSAAFGAPRETVDIVAANGGNALTANHTLAGDAAGTDPHNSVVNAAVTGTAGGAYNARSVRVVGTVGSWGAGTYGSETTVRVTAPSGEFVEFHPSTQTSTPAADISFDMSANIVPGTTGGTWVVTTYETYDDASIDSTYSALSVTIDDAALPVGAPASFVNLGDLSTTESTVSSTITNATPGEVHWFKMHLPAVNAVGGGYVDIWASPIDPTNPISPADLDDTDLALYSATSAALVTYDDLTGPGFFGQLSYGSTTARPANVFAGQTAGTAFTGQSGVLAAGDYYLAVGQYTMAHPASIPNNWGAVTSSYTGARNTTSVFVHSVPATAPYAPTGVGSALVLSSTSELLTVVVTPGGNPASTTITVTGDVSSMGGSATAAFHDDGLNGDAAASDGVYSFVATIPAGTVDGQLFTIPFTVADAQARSSTGNIGFSIDVNNQIAAADVPSGSGDLASLDGVLDFANDVDIFKIAVCDFANFSASTEGGTTADTRLWLFNEDGTGVTFNDDIVGGTSLQSALSAQFLTHDGNYYLAVSRYTVAALDATGQQIWNPADLFRSENAPDGPGAANPVAGWTGTSAGTASYTIALTGSCYPTTGPTLCSVADVGIAGGLPGHDHLLNNNDFIAFITLFFASDPQADMGMAGGLAGSDGQWNNNDFIAFIGHFFDDAAACNG